MTESSSDIDPLRLLLQLRRQQATQARIAAAAALRAANKRAEAAETRAAELEGRLSDVLASSSWRFTTPLRRLLGKSSSPPIPSSSPETPPLAASSDDYTHWLDSFDKLTPADEAELRQLAADARLSRLLVLAPGCRPNELRNLSTALDGGFYGRWRLLISPEVSQQDLAELPADLRSRCVFPSTEPLVSDDEKLAVLRPWAIPAKHALLLLASAATDPAVRLVYADEDRVSPDGTRFDPFFKPNFSPELLEHCDLLGGIVLLSGTQAELQEVARELLTESDVAAVLRRTARPLRGSSVVRLSEILSHDLRPLGDVISQPEPVPEAADLLASIIIPTRDHYHLLHDCLAGVFATTLRPNENPPSSSAAPRAEIIVIDNGSSDPMTLELLTREQNDGRIRVLREPGPFNYSRLNNTAARTARGDVLVFLNNDTVVHDPDWLRRLLAAVGPSDVGAVGARLLYPDGTVQHGGIILGAGGTVIHADLRQSADDPGPRGLATMTREVAAVTGALLAIRRDVFWRAGGFDEGLAVAFNDVKLCLDLLKLGYRNLRIGTALMVHHDGSTRGRDEEHEKIRAFRAEARRARGAHFTLFREDPYHSPNLSLSRPGQPAFPPRRARAWRRNSSHLRIILAAATHEHDRLPATLIVRVAELLRRRGHEVLLAGPPAAQEPALYREFERIHLSDARALATQAVERAADWVVIQGHLFNALPILLGAACRTALLDMGDRYPRSFPDADSAFLGKLEADLARDLVDLVHPVQLAALGDAEFVPQPQILASRRAQVRAVHGWTDQVVVLSAIPLAHAEADQSGLNDLLALIEALDLGYPGLAYRTTFLAQGGGAAVDVDDTVAAGIAVFGDGPAAMADAFAAADLYLSPSLTADFDVGVLRALAHGLPVIAWDRPSVHGLPISRGQNQADLLCLLAHGIEAVDTTTRRAPVVLVPDEAAFDLGPLLEGLPAR